MKLGLSTAAFYGRWETEEAAEAIGKMPVDCAEVFLQTSSEYDFGFVSMVRQNLGQVPCTSVHPSGIQFENQMFGRSKRQRQDAFDMFYRALDACAALGAQYYVYHGRSTAQLSPRPFELQANVDMMGEMNVAAQRRGLKIAWENVFWCQLTTAERVRKIVDALPQVCFTLDIKQAMRAGEDPTDMALAMGKNLVNVHICDWMTNGKLCLPGEGQYDFSTLFSVLQRTGYTGPVIVEPYLALIESDEALIRSVAYLRDLLKIVHTS